MPDELHNCIPNGRLCNKWILFEWNRWPAPQRRQSKEQRSLPPPQRAFWSVYTVYCQLLTYSSAQEQRWKSQRDWIHSDSHHCGPLNIRPVRPCSKICETDAVFWGSDPPSNRSLRVCWIEVYALDPPPPPPQEFVIPWRSCWVSCGVGVEEVWWIKLLSPLTHYTFPLDAAAWWITIGLEEAGGGERGRGRKS